MVDLANNGLAPLQVAANPGDAFVLDNAVGGAVTSDPAVTSPFYGFDSPSVIW